MAGTVVYPEFVLQDGRSHTYDNDSNVTVWPYSAMAGSTCKTQAAAPTRASTTVTYGPDCMGIGTVQATWDGIWYFWAQGQSVTVPQQIYNILTASGSGYTVT